VWLMDEIAALALGIAASPFAIIPAVMVLFTERPRAVALTFLFGWFSSLAVIATVFALISGAIATGNEPPSWISWVRIAAGIALVVIAVRMWVTRKSSAKTPGWMQTLQDATPRSAFVLATMLSIANPKVLLLAAAAGVDIGGAEWVIQQQVIAIAGFAAIASVTVAAPVVAYLVAGERILGPLARVKDWLLRHNAVVLALVFLLLGALLLWNGATGAVST
jgi:threonine/homoserine/homoserine lactone efflux protein